MLLDPPEPIETLAELPDGAPARFIWRRVARRVVARRGPRAALAGVVAAPPGRPRGRRTRDYYRVEDDEGRRYWLFREGLYGREDAGPAEERAAPSWWMHGVLS